MKTLPLVFSLIVIALSGCAYPGYQRTYVGYSSGYSSGYDVHRYYDYPSRSYYQPGGVIRYQQYYVPPRYPRHHHDDDHHEKRNWGMSDREQRHEHWQRNNAQRDWQGNRTRVDRAWSSHIQKRQAIESSNRSMPVGDRSMGEGRNRIHRSQRHSEHAPSRGPGRSRQGQRRD